VSEPARSASRGETNVRRLCLGLIRKQSGGKFVPGYCFTIYRVRFTTGTPRMIDAQEQVARRQIEVEREGLLRRISTMLQWPMTVLAFVWLATMIVEFSYGGHALLEAVNYGIWSLFILHFLLELWIAPRKTRYLRRNWLTAIALFLPAIRLVSVLRLFRILQVARVGRSVRLVRWLASLNRGMRATQHTVQRRGLTYIIALTALVMLGGAAGIFVFENPRALGEAELLLPDGRSITSFGEALWWTSMMLTTMGTDYFPRSTEGRIIAWLLAVYAFAIFGYITATVASLIIRVDMGSRKGVASEVQLLREEVAELKGTLDRMSTQLARVAEGRE
jgi:voltage-gated potassium channel